MTECKKFIHNDTLKMSDEEIRQICKESIGILYGSDNYACNLKHINELKECILKDYPDTKDENIEVWFINDTESRTHARCTMLRVCIPTEDYIKLKDNGLIYRL